MFLIATVAPDLGGTGPDAGPGAPQVNKRGIGGTMQNSTQKYLRKD
jgi:hypothetical protein